jgi:hypothetical protein
LEFGDLPLLEGPHITKVVDPHISWAPSPNPRRASKKRYLTLPYLTLSNSKDLTKVEDTLLSFFLSFFFGYVGPSTFVIKVPQISRMGECLGEWGFRT